MTCSARRMKASIAKKSESKPLFTRGTAAAPDDSKGGQNGPCTRVPSFDDAKHVMFQGRRQIVEPRPQPPALQVDRGRMGNRDLRRARPEGRPSSSPTRPWRGP